MEGRKGYDFIVKEFSISEVNYEQVCIKIKELVWDEGDSEQEDFPLTILSLAETPPKNYFLAN